MTPDELNALVRWTNALGPLLELTEPIAVERLGPDSIADARCLESAGVVNLREVEECPVCGGWTGEHLEDHAPVALGQRRVIAGRPRELFVWIEDALRAVGWELTDLDSEPTVLSHAIERAIRLEGHDLLMRLAIGPGEPALRHPPGARVLRLRLGSAPAVHDQARVVDVDAAALLRDAAARHAARRAIDRLEVLLPLPLLELESELTDRDRRLILDAARAFLATRDYLCTSDPNDWGRLFGDLGADSARAIFACTARHRDVKLVFCRCDALAGRLHAHGFTSARSQNALAAEPSMRDFLAGLARIYDERVEVRHRFDRLKELGEQVRLGVGAVVFIAAAAAGSVLHQFTGLNLDLGPAAAIPAVAGLLLLRSHLRYARDALRLSRWDWHVE